MVQMKEQIKTPEKELSKLEISNLSDAEFKTLVIRIFNKLRGKADRENFNSIKKAMKTIKKNQSEMKDTLTAMKNNYRESTVQ